MKKARLFLLSFLLIMALGTISVSASPNSYFHFYLLRGAASTLDGYGHKDDTAPAIINPQSGDQIQGIELVNYRIRGHYYEQPANIERFPMISYLYSRYYYGKFSAEYYSGEAYDRDVYLAANYGADQPHSECTIDGVWAPKVSNIGKLASDIFVFNNLEMRNKKMIRKREFFIVFSLCIMTFLTSCSNNKTLSNVNSSSSTTSSAQSTETKIKKTLCNNLNVDIVVGTDLSKADTYYIAIDSFNAQSLSEILLKGSKINNSTNGKESIKFTTDDGKTLYVENGISLRYQGHNFQYYKNVLHTIKTDKYYNLNNFTNNDLQFKTRDNATKDVSSIIESLGISSVTISNMYSLDYKTLQKQEEYLKTKSDLSTNLKDPQITWKGNWTVNDDCYYMNFRYTIKGIPIVSINHGSIDNNTYISGSIINAYYSENGLLYLDINHKYKIISTEKTNQNLITINEALDILKKKYQDIILTDPTNITKAELCYVPTFKDKSHEAYYLVPAWCFSLSQNMTSSKNVTSQTIVDTNVIINAIDGNEII
jgi:hypothetical protein